MRKAAQLVQETMGRVNDTAHKRDGSKTALARWHHALDEWHRAMGLLYPDAFWEDLERLRSGDVEAVEPAIAFLEADPWAFRSGYVKQTVVHLLKRLELSAEQAGRLRSVILQVVDVGDRREFLGYCKLARRVIDDGLRDALLERLHSSEPGRARRALWVLDYLREPLAPRDRAAARAVLDQAATDRMWWRVSGWVRADVQRYADAAWIDELLARAVAGGPNRGPALRLLTTVRIDPTNEQRRVLGALVLAGIHRDEDDWIEGIAVHADLPGFRDQLLAAYETAAEDGVRRRAAWAIHAIRRATGDEWPGDALGP
jgi:hypothetical protein